MVTTLLRKYGPWALIVGGSEGVGAAFAARLAEQGFNLILTGYREDTLEATVSDLKQKFAVEVRQVVHDLTESDPLAPVTAITADVDVGLLAYTAGSVRPAPFLDESLDFALRPLRLNALGQTAYCHHYGQRMRERGGGGIILIGSNAGIYGIGGLATYAAAKAYTKVLSESLWQELRPHGIDVLGLILGPTRTPFIERLGAPVDDPAFAAAFPDDLAAQGLEALGKVPVAFAPNAAPIIEELAALDRSEAIERMTAHTFGIVGEMIR